MKLGNMTAILPLAAAIAGCVPAGGGYQPGPGPAVGPANQPSTATSQEIVQYVSNGSAFIEYFEGSPISGSYECGYFDSNGDYDAYWTDYRGEDDFYGGWSVRGNQLCFHGQWSDGSAHIGCNLAEWSTVDTLLMINGSNQVVVEIRTSDGPAEYNDYCGL